jgi:ubiquitin-conjugating enzyme E2 J1
MKEFNELREEASSQYTAAPLEEDLFEHHFTIRGPAGTSFEKGIYHGRILLPPEYPFKPPSIIFMTVSFRWGKADFF